MYITSEDTKRGSYMQYIGPISRGGRYCNTTKYQLATCFYDRSHPQAFFSQQTMPERHKQRVQTSTILNLYIKHTLLT